MLRMIGPEEMECVWGGEPEIVVKGRLTDKSDPRDRDAGPRGGGKSDGGKIGGSGGGSGTRIAQGHGWAAGAALDFIVNILSEKAIDLSEQETEIAKQFDPNEVLRNLQGMDRNGNIDRGWQMRDGSTFFDRDGNNKPDIRMWTDRPGNVWIDQGDGRTLVRAAG